MRALPCFCIASLSCFLVSSCAQPSQSAPHSPSASGALTISEHGQKENLVRVQNALAKTMTENGAAASNLLDFFMGGEGELLGESLNWQTWAYAEELAFFELLLRDHDGEEWDKILNHHGWIWEKCYMLHPEAIEPANRDKLESLWTLERLDARIRDLASGEVRLLSSAVREIRVFEQLSCIPEDREAVLNKAMEVAMDTAMNMEGTAEELQLLHLMEDRGDFPTTLNSFVWEAARSPSLDLRAEALLVGPRFSSSTPETVQGDRMSWNSLLVAALKDPDPQVANAALIGMDLHRYGQDPASTRLLTSQALRILKHTPWGDPDARVISACLSVLSTRPYGAENLSASEWLKTLSPILESSDPTLKYPLPLLALHRFPESREARSLLSDLAHDETRRIRWQALMQSHRLELGEDDVPWLQSLLSEREPQLQVLIMVALLRASSGKLDEKTNSTLLRWAQEDFDAHGNGTRPFLYAYLYFMAIQPDLPKSSRDLLLSAAKTKDKRLQRLARVALAAQGWLSEAEADKLRSSLAGARGEDRDNALLCLYVLSLRQGKQAKAEQRLDEILEQEDEMPIFSHHSPAVWFALRMGGLTMKQKKAIVQRMIDPPLDRILPTSEQEWRLCATLGKAWIAQKGHLEASLESAKEETRAKNPGWFDSYRRAQGLSLLLAALK